MGGSRYDPARPTVRKPHARGVERSPASPHPHLRLPVPGETAPLNVRKEKITEYGLSIARITAAKRGEDILLDNGDTLPNAELTYRPYAPRSYAYLSDTSLVAQSGKLVEGADLLYHETTYAHAEHKIARERGHSTTVEAARIALKAGAGRLVIGHYSSRYKEESVLVEEARTVFPDTHPATEGTTFTIEKRQQP